MNRSILPPFDPKPFRPIRPPMVYVRDPLKWEYKRIARNLESEGPLDEAELNALGKEEWELAGIAQYASNLLYYFKRVLDK